MTGKKMKTILLAGIFCISLSVPVMASDLQMEEIAFLNSGNVAEIEKKENHFTDGVETENYIFSSGEESSEQTEKYEETEGTEGLEYAYIEETDSYQVVKGVNQKTVVIPTTYEGKYVTEIGPGAFAGYDKVESVGAFHYSLTGIIREGAFENCKNLRMFQVNNGVSIESNAFRGCHKMARFYAEKTEESVIAYDAFDADTKVLFVGIVPPYDKNQPFYSVSLEAGLLFEEQGATVLQSWYVITPPGESGREASAVIDYDNSSTNINLNDERLRCEIVGKKAFYGCDLVQQVVLSEDMKIIGTKAFAECTNLQQIYIPPEVYKIAEDAFFNCPEVTLYVEEGSYAEKYAKEQGIPYTCRTVEPEQPYLIHSASQVSNHTLYFTVGLLRDVEGAEGYEFQSLASDGKTVLRTKKSATYTTVLRNAPNDIYVRGRYWKQENGQKIYSPWSNTEHLYMEIKGGNMTLNKAVVSGKTVTLTFADNVNFFQESDGYDCKLQNANGNAGSYMLRNQKYRTIRYTNVKKGTYYVIAKAYKLVNGRKYYGESSNIRKIIVR